MSKISRRKLIPWGSERLPEFPVIAVAGQLARNHGLVPPDSSGVHGRANSDLRRAAIVDRHSVAREFSRDRISKEPFANAVDPLATSFNGCRPAVLRTGAVCRRHAARPTSFSLAEIRHFR